MPNLKDENSKAKSEMTASTDKLAISAAAGKAKSTKVKAPKGSKNGDVTIIKEAEKPSVPLPYSSPKRL